MANKFLSPRLKLSESFADAHSTFPSTTPRASPPSTPFPLQTFKFSSPLHTQETQSHSPPFPIHEGLASERNASEHKVLVLLIMATRP